MDYPIQLEAITRWFASKADSLAGTGVKLVEIASRSEYVPAALADFGSDFAIGRITFWVTGQVDFEVLDCADGESLLFRHEIVETLDTRQLDEAYDAFIAATTGTDLNPKFARLHRCISKRDSEGVGKAMFGLSPIHNGWDTVPDEVVERLLAMLTKEEMYKSHSLVRSSITSNLNLAI
jgi:hypothetical protein